MHLFDTSVKGNTTGGVFVTWRMKTFKGPLNCIQHEPGKWKACGIEYDCSLPVCVTTIIHRKHENNLLSLIDHEE